MEYFSATNRSSGFSNVAKETKFNAPAQKVIWEQFPDHRPARVVAAISERCRLAVSNEETISETRKMNQSNGRGMRI
jgi:hypothetical protein